MKKIFFRIVILTIVASICLTAFAACKSRSGTIKKNDMIGKWYDEEGDCFDIRSDGTWKLDGWYGTGTWKILDGGEYEFTDFYGDPDEATIDQSEFGTYIKFSGEIYYKDSYPTGDTEDATAKSNSTTTTAAAVKLDPFKGISYTVSGISPYCKITVNNQKCDTDVQKYVTYSFDKERYENGDTAKITATLKSYTDGKTYSLSKTTAEYKISGQPEYIDSVDGVNFSSVTKELEDYIKEKISSSIGTRSFFGNDVYYQDITSDTSNIKTITSSLEKKYFSSLKVIHEDSMRSGTPYNKYSFVYSFNVTDIKGKSGKLYVTINACNIVKYSDGSIKWGTNSLEAYDFTYGTSTESVENCVTTNIMNNSVKYNIKELPKK